ncbi:MAG: cobyric acid synthase [Alphaproteobacteria bacterium]|nr:cobyric acid synthase [Alphaproteobacteria bacterium]
MIQGTGSHVGKSLLVAALARAYAARGLAVRPFKPQNMSNNAAVAAGGEIGRAQALQARAAGVPASVHMNPVLLKPQSDRTAQVVVQGQVAGAARAAEYRDWKPRLMPRVLESFAALESEADLMLVEGAGSPAEVNLRDNDIANMGFAETARVPVVLVGDVDRGGVIASLVGTWELMNPAERALIKGYVINRFRGDPALFDGAVETITARTGLPCLGIVPYAEAATRLPSEDSVALDSHAFTNQRGGATRPVRVVVPRLPRIANFDDLDPLSLEPAVELIVVPQGQPLPGDADLIVLPGSKATRADLAVLVTEGWDIDIRAHHRRSGTIVGLCAGFQMLGAAVADPAGLEGTPGVTPGLGLLDVTTEIRPAKRLVETRGFDLATGQAVAGYEMHMGVTRGAGLDRPMLEISGLGTGARSADGRVMGCYLHGLFAADGYRAAFLARLRAGTGTVLAYEASVERALDELASTVAGALDLDRLLAIAEAR